MAIDNKLLPMLPFSTETALLPPINENLIDSSLNKRMAIREAFERAIGIKEKKDRNQRRLDILNRIRTQGEVEKKEDIKPTAKVKISPNDIGTELVMLENTDKVSSMMDKVYDIIIKEFKSKGISNSALYCILQNIPFIDIIEDVIVVYNKSMEIYDKLEIPCVNIALALRNEFKDENLKIKFIPFKHISISDYFAKNIKRKY